ncbi:glycosyltransferase family 2 protein [Geodermatophilus obscurus]|uniref:Glycosyl transferase family protein n=1 Tax=Geodermatophilus obscurus (strain ATCC 25078 / DSM 43160 / JCM 3152 / CCUG 61914 / KCC A-0152 / KCTC 9177 / NBRC 13315 / NRRL B-3577 / G-20) TaxID=526225 RepID=D2S587_GEOOG|nr:glycosyltransferase [Geodermatophilus obscurus]ADB73198.1 glycosyl transferase family protein [Geodermatophilus obscurus DSM 43160]
MTGPTPRDRQVAVVLASAGRPELLAEVVADLGRQTVQDFTLVVSVPDRDSLPPRPLPEGTLLVHDRGLAAQRNAGLAAVPDATHVFCFDDDAVVREDYLERGVAFFDAHPDVVALTGRVLLDGATGDAIPRDESDEALAASLTEPLTGAWEPSRELYGCNFAFRPDAVAGERFDARLPLYSWLEDHDFARRAMRHGKLARVHDCVIVHRGVKSGGRTAHERLGYSQVMNPAYLHHVGSFPLWLTVYETLPRVGKNAVRAVRGPETAWRRERLRGNLVALRDVVRRRFTPERILELR